jgi:hypothetical protein
MNHELNPRSLVARRLTAPAAGGFLLCPLWTSAAEWAWQEPLYRWALSEAQAVTSPSLPERDLLAVWN